MRKTRGGWEETFPLYYLRAWHRLLLESFRFEDEKEHEIKLKVFARALKKRHPGKLHFTFFFSPKTFSTVIYTEGG